MVSTSGGSPIQLTTDPGKDSSPKWRPRKNSLTFLSKRDNDETQVFELTLPGGEPHKLTDVKQGVDDFEWSLDGEKLALVITDPDQDWNVPLINSEQMYQALRRMNVDTMLIVYPGESHEIDAPYYVKDRFERYLAWYGYYLLGKPAKIP